MKKRLVLFGLLIFALSFGLFAKAPKRIVSLSPSATEILYAVGAEKQVVAVSEFSDYPAEASSKPVVGGFDGKTLSLEKIISFEPDFVYMTDGMHNFLIDQLKTYGISYYLSKGDSIEAVKAEILDIGKITGHEKEAKKVVKGIDDDLASPVTGASATIYYEVWNAPFMTCGTKSFIHDVIVKAGCKNIFDDLAEAYPMVSEESIIARNPQVILVPSSAGVSIESVKARAGWNDIDAVKNGRVYLIDDQLYSRPGPRVGKCIKELSGLVR